MYYVCFTYVLCMFYLMTKAYQRQTEGWLQEVVSNGQFWGLAG